MKLFTFAGDTSLFDINESPNDSADKLNNDLKEMHSWEKTWLVTITGRKNGFTDIANVTCSCSEDHICLSFHTFAQKQTLYLHHIWS